MAGSIGCAKYKVPTCWISLLTVLGGPGGMVGAAALQIILGTTGVSAGMLRSTLITTQASSLLHRFVGPLTLAPTVTLVGLSLYSAGTQCAALVLLTAVCPGAPLAGTNWGSRGFGIAAVILFSQVLRDKHKIFRLFPVRIFAQTLYTHPFRRR